jgi:small-conductance mechanosensitive channel
VLERRLEDPERRYIATKTVDYLLGLVSVLVLLRIWLGGFRGLAASIGIISAGLAIALHSPLTNLAGWIFLAVRRPFVIGDRIQIGDHAGDVIDLAYPTVRDSDNDGEGRPGRPRDPRS